MFRLLVSNGTSGSQERYEEDEIKHKLELTYHVMTLKNFEMRWPAIKFLTVFLPIIALVGTIGNILVIYVYGPTMKRNRGSVFIVCLAAIDLFICSIVIPNTLYFEVWMNNVTDAGCRILSFTKAFTIPASALILVVIAADRFLVICFIPGIVIRSSVVRLIFCFLVGLVILLSVPQALTSGTIVPIRATPENGLERNVQLELHTTCQNDEQVLSFRFQDVYECILTAIFLLMFLTLSVLYSSIFIFVRRHVYRRHKIVFHRMNIQKCDVSAAQRTSIENENQTIVLATSTGTNIDMLCHAQGTSPTELTEEELDSHVKCKRVSFHETLLGVVNIKEDTGIAASHAMQETPTTSLAKRLSTVLPVPSNSPASQSDDEDYIEEDWNADSRDKVKMEVVIPILKKEESTRAQQEKNEDQPFPTERHKQRQKYQPHIKSAKTLAVVTLIFMLSYTPYFIISNQNLSDRRRLAAAKTRPEPPSLTKEAKLGKNNSSSCSSNLTTATVSMQLKYENSSSEKDGEQKAHAELNGDTVDIVVINTQMIVFFFYFIASAANPIIYSCMNSMFQQEIRQLLCNLRIKFRTTTTRRRRSSSLRGSISSTSHKDKFMLMSSCDEQPSFHQRHLMSDSSSKCEAIKKALPVVFKNRV